MPKLSFLPKKKTLLLLRIIYNYIPVNKHKIQSQYLVHYLGKFDNIINKLECKIYFSSNVANGYLGILIKESD